MQELDLEGLFWRPEAPDREIAGRLRYDPTDGAILSLIEPFRFNATDGAKITRIDFMGNRPEDGDGIRFLGIAGSHLLTLDQCDPSGGSLESSRIIQRRYRVIKVLMGAHFGVNDPLRFRSVTVQLSNLVQWVGHTGLSVDLHPKGDAGKVERLSIHYATVPSIEADTDDGSIAVSFPWWCRPDPFGKSTVEHKCALEYRFREPQPLAKIMQVCSAFRNLVTICVRAPSAILDTKLTHPDVDRPVDFYTRWIGAGSPNDGKAIDRSKMLFTFDDIGGLGGIRAWLNLAGKYSVVVALLVSHWYVPPLYQEQRYFNAVVAVETLIRIRRNKNSITLRKALGDLVQEVDSLFGPLVGDLKGWTQEVVRTRDNYVVHPGLRGNSDGYRLYLLSESIYVLVVIALLRECDVSDHSLKNIQNHEHFKWLAAELVTSA